MTKLFSRFLKDESGATAIEYGLIAALISVALIAGATSLGTKINATFNSLATTMNGAAAKGNVAIP
ncbi:Flp family type IVb pilin [Rhizobium mongolense]|uniref:Flp family type IVb pilin n=1 Tax=Rhizobium TaxID=379 RepID=UPI0024B19534|nr:Flp family type IVb pilin [Rhizobium sp. CC1099]WFU87390.1 Flp family type IVb pilin [Rhizobium sp. CC1099]